MTVAQETIIVQVVDRLDLFWVNAEMPYEVPMKNLIAAMLEKLSLFNTPDSLYELSTRDPGNSLLMMPL